MPKVRIIEYEGTDDEILRLLRQGASSGVANPNGETTSNNGGNHNGAWDKVALKFAKHVSDTAAWGRAGQQKAMRAWLSQRNGEIAFKELWKAAGVKTEHDYAGIGGSLTKNMVKSGGPKEWYRYYTNVRGEWIYKVLDEMLEPLREAFGIK